MATLRSCLGKDSLSWKEGSLWKGLTVLATDASIRQLGAKLRLENHSTVHMS